VNPHAGPDLRRGVRVSRSCSLRGGLGHRRLFSRNEPPSKSGVRSGVRLSARCGTVGHAQGAEFRSIETVIHPARVGAACDWRQGQSVLVFCGAGPMCALKTSGSILITPDRGKDGIKFVSAAPRNCYTFQLRRMTVWIEMTR
jgi:hypothetical protein